MLDETFKVVHDGKERYILCFSCGKKSYHPVDIESLFCAECGKFHNKVRGSYWVTLRDDSIAEMQSHLIVQKALALLKAKDIPFLITEDVSHSKLFIVFREAKHVLEWYSSLRTCGLASENYALGSSNSESTYLQMLKTAKDMKELRSVYISLVKKNHPDVGGKNEEMAELNRVYEESKARFTKGEWGHA